NIIIEGINYVENDIRYGESRGLISAGEINNKIDNVKLLNISITGKTYFSSYDMKTQFHYMYVNSDNLVIENCSFKNKVNRLPIIHVNSNLKNVKIQNNTFSEV